MRREGRLSGESGRRREKGAGVCERFRGAATVSVIITLVNPHLVIRLCGGEGRRGGGNTHFAGNVFK